MREGEYLEVTVLVAPPSSVTWIDAHNRVADVLFEGLSDWKIQDFTVYCREPSHPPGDNK